MGSVGEIRFQMMEPEASVGNVLLTIKCIQSEILLHINPYLKRKCNPIIDKDSLFGQTLVKLSELSSQLGPDFWASTFLSSLSSVSKNPAKSV